VHTLAFLEPGHFHATLTLREANPRVAPEIFVYATAGPELDDFLALVDRFNRRAGRPTRWRPRVQLSEDPLARLVSERPGDLVVLAGRNGGKARVIRRLHDAGLHVLADKPWLVRPADLDDIRASLDGAPIVREMMTGRRDSVARLVKRLVADAALFGGFAGTESPAIEQESVHHFEKQVDGAPLRRPWWYFDSRVQGGGAVDIATHLVDQVQWLLDAERAPAGEAPTLLAARGWSTRVPLEVFARVSRAGSVPADLRSAVEGDALRVFCNADLTYALAGVTAHSVTRWEISTPPGGGDTSRVVLHGRAALIRVEQSAATGFHRRLTVEARGDAAATARALGAVLAAASAELPGVAAKPREPGVHEILIPPGLDPGHEAHFAELLGEMLDWIDAGHWPAPLAARTLAKYALLADAAAATAGDEAAGR
jgi:predicted dehydrogenase